MASASCKEGSGNIMEFGVEGTDSLERAHKDLQSDEGKTSVAYGKRGNAISELMGSEEESVKYNIK
jgi:hypothetical protein